MATRKKQHKKSVHRKPAQKPGTAADAAGDADDGRKNPLRVIGRGVVPPILHDAARRKEMGLPESEDVPGRYMVELNILYNGGLARAAEEFVKVCKTVLGSELGDVRRPVEISKSYFQVRLSVREWRKLLKHDEDAAKKNPGMRLIYKLWPDFKVKALIDRSVATIKADAAFKSYAATGAGITWAVIDSGIDGTHPHFGTKSDKQNSAIYHANVEALHRDFTVEGRPPTLEGALHDGLGHGTHVAGIIAGKLPNKTAKSRAGEPVPFAVFEQVFEADAEGQRAWGKVPVERKLHAPEALHGVSPDCTLVSLKVLDANGEGRVTDIMRALVYVREQLNDDPKILRVHGVNLSVGYDFDAQMFACGQSPLCVEVDRLVKSGVVVVAAAGNTGYGNVSASERDAKVGLSNTINDPGNAALAITVGSTHRDSPHTYGVSFFSSKGPTGDGRLKPDLVAPGERITSCAAKAKRDKLGIRTRKGVAAYVDESGTSMAAPHVSGAIAAFLSIRREFIQRPEEVKRIFLETATSLGRERYFQGNGLVDLMRAIQSV